MASGPSKECGAETRDGGLCRRRSVRSSGCRFHGSRLSDGEDGPSQRRARHSPDLPTQPRAAYESASGAREPLPGREDVALLQVILEEKIAELDQAASSPDLAEAVTRAQWMASNWRTWDWTRMERELAALKESLAGGRDRRDEVMREVRRLTREKAALVAQVDKERRYRAEFVSIEDLILVVRALMSVLAKTVRDPKALGAIEAGLRTVFEEFDAGRMKGGRRRATS
jgi:hypothetical protein